VERLDLEAITIDGRSGGGVPALAYPFHLPQVRFTTCEPSFGELPEEPYVLASTTDQHLDDIGARIVLLDLSGFYPESGLIDGMALWVQPGPELDRLEAEGALLPAAFPTGLPASARRASLEIVDQPVQVEIGPGDRLALQVWGRHTGTGSPWPDQASYGRDARVRIIADVQPLDEGLPQSTRSGGELPRWIRPGETFAAAVDVVAVDQMLEPLPPGRYRVTLGVGQDDPAWFSPSEATGFDMVVTG